MKGLLNFEDTNNLKLNNLKLFRYYKMDDFLKTVKSKTLYLKKPHCWNDPFENLFLKSRIFDIDEKPIEMGIMKERVFAQCWTLKEESDLMWNNFIPDNIGVKVEVTLKNLNNSIQNNSDIRFIGKMKYLTIKEIENYFSQTFILTLDDIAKPIFESLLIKRKEFSEEHEVRILFFDLFRNNKSNKIFIVNKNPNDYKDDFTTISISPELFEKVVFHPKMSDKSISKYKSQIRGFGYKGEIEKSKLYNIPEIKIILDHKGKLSPAPNKGYTQ